MNCTCSSNIKIKPFDSCIFCAHKHAASALALTNFLIESNSILLLKIHSQLTLSKWHLSKKYESLINKNVKICNNILQLKEFKNDLIDYVENLWALIHDKAYDNIVINNEDFFSIKNNEFKDGMLAISNSIELLKYEYNYKNINFSYAIGQLVIATWIFQDIDSDISNLIRNFYKDIESIQENNKQINQIIPEMNKLLSNLWLTYLNKYIQS